MPSLTRQITLSPDTYTAIATGVAQCRIAPIGVGAFRLHVGSALPAPGTPDHVAARIEPLCLTNLARADIVYARAETEPVVIAVLTGSGGALELAGYDALDDMLKVKSVQKKMRDSFTRPLADLWQVTAADGASATIAGGTLTISSGTTAGAVVELLSKDSFTIPFRAMAGVVNTRHANNHQILEAVSVDALTGLPDGKHCFGIDIGGAASTTATLMRYFSQNGGLTPLESATVTILTTASASILEIEPFSDEAYVHSRAIDATSGRANSYVRHQQIPDPSALYKLRLRSLNHAAWKAVTGAVAGTGGVIRLTVTAHGLATGNLVWVEYLNGISNAGAELRGNFTVTVIDANQIDLQGTVFAGAHVAGSGRIALAAAPTAVSLQMSFINCQDYAELTAEITAGRGQIVEGQAIAARTVAGSVVTATALGPVAHDGARGSTAPVIVAARAVTAAYASVASGDVADLITTVQGVQVVRPWQIPELEWSSAAAAGGITNTTDVVLGAAAGAGLRRFVTALQLKNAGTVATEVVLKDGSTVIWRGHLGASMTFSESHQFADPLRTTANTALNLACITTGAQVYVNAQGFIAP